MPHAVRKTSVLLAALLAISAFFAISASASPLMYKHHACKHHAQHKCHKSNPKHAGPIYEKGAECEAIVVVEHSPAGLPEVMCRPVVDNGPPCTYTTSECPPGPPIIEDSPCVHAPSGCPVNYPPPCSAKACQPAEEKECPEEKEELIGLKAKT